MIVASENGENNRTDLKRIGLSTFDGFCDDGNLSFQLMVTGISFMVVPKNGAGYWTLSDHDVVNAEQ